MKKVILLLFTFLLLIPKQSFPLPHGELIVTEENTFHYIWRDTVYLTTVKDSVYYLVETTPLLVIQYVIRHNFVTVPISGSDTSAIIEAKAFSLTSYGIDNRNELQELTITFDHITVRRPLYSRLTVMAGIEGTAYIKAFLDKNGGISNIDVIKSSGNSLLDKNALDIVEKAEYCPAILNDVSIEVLLLIPITFRLKYPPK